MTKGLPDAEAAVRVLIAQKDMTPWFWKPQWHWFGWKTLIPFSYGHDEHARRTFLLGWTITGRVIFPLWDCGDPECHRDAIEAMKNVENDRPDYCCGVCPGIVGGGYDCTCQENPRCPKYDAENMLEEPESDEKDARLSTKGDTK